MYFSIPFVLFGICGAIALVVWIIDKAHKADVKAQQLYGKKEKPRNKR